MLKPGVDYDLVSLNDGNKIGPATVTIKGRGNYDGQLISGNVVIITQKSLRDGDIEVDLKTQLSYSGGEKFKIKPEDIAVYHWSDGTRILVDSKEYTVEECRPKPAGAGFALGSTVSVTVRAQEDGHYRDFKMVQGEIVEANIGDDTVFEVQGIVNKQYTGSALEQDNIILVDRRTGNQVDPSKYVVRCEDNTKIGTATVIITANDKDGCYTGVRKETFNITERILKADIEVTVNNVVYDGTKKTEETGAISVKVWDDQGNLVDRGAYELSYSDDTVNAGPVTVIATPKTDSTYAGKAEGTYTITQADNDVDVTPVKVEVGQTAKIAVTAFGPISGYVSDKTSVATVSADGVVKGVAAGTATVTFTVAGDRNHVGCTGSVAVTVTEKANGKVTASGVKKVFKTKKQSFTISATALGNAPISFKSDNKNITVNATTGKVTVKAGYVGTASITITAAETDGYKKATKTVKVTIVPKATTLKSVTSKNGKITAKWAKKNIATCYQLQYATDKNFTKNKGKVWSKSETATSKTIKKTFTKGKTYYVRIRTCTRTDKSELLYSAWSAAKKVTIK